MYLNLLSPLHTNKRKIENQIITWNKFTARTINETQKGGFRQFARFH